MFPFLDKLSETEKDLVMNAMPIITVMIAAADGKVDSTETGWASKLADIRSYSNEEALQGYYEEISKDFDQKVRMMVKELPDNTKEAIPGFVAQLEQFNQILPKMPHDIAGVLLKSMKSFAKHIARASGGFLKIASISKEEQALIDLPMITYIPPVIEEEETPAE